MSEETREEFKNRQIENLLGYAKKAGEITEEKAAEVSEHDKAIWDQEGKSSIIPDEELHTSSIISDERLAGLPEVAESEEDADPVDTGEDQEDLGDKPEEMSHSERAAAARLTQIVKLRKTTRSLKKQMDERDVEVQNLKDSIKALNDTGVEFTDEELEDIDRIPGMRYLLEKDAKADEERVSLKETKGSQDEDGRRAAEIVRVATESANDFIAHTPGWEDAHQSARDRFAKENEAQYGFSRMTSSDRERALSALEFVAAETWIEQGLDPATEIWNYGKGVETAVSGDIKPETDTETKRDVVSPRKVTRIREGLAQPSLSAMEGESPAGRSRVITLAQVHSEFSYNDVLKILSNEDLMEQLQTEGSANRSEVMSMVG